MIVSRGHFWEVFFTKLRFNLKSEVSKTYLGYLWWLLEPVLHVVAMYLVFGIFLNLRTEKFILFLVCGQIPFMWFSKSVMNATQSVVTGRGLIGQVAIPKIIFPTLSVSQDLVKQLVVFIAMIGFLLAMGERPSFAWLGLVPVAIVQFTFIIASAYLVAAIVPVVPDFRYLVQTGLTMLMFGSGIFYSYESVILPRHQELFLLNPMANLIKIYREVLLDHQAPDWLALAWIALASLVLVAVMYYVFRKNESVYARLVLQ